MSRKYPIVAVTGSSGAGTTTVLQSFKHIFRREKIEKVQIIEGDAFHRFDRKGMRAAMQEMEQGGKPNFSHFGPEANLLAELEETFRRYSENGRGRVRKYLHDAQEAAPYKQEPGTFTPWEEIPPDTDMLFYEGLHGAAVAGDIDVGRHPDLLIGVVPIINLEWRQKLHRDQNMRGSSQAEGVVTTGKWWPRK